MQNRRSANAFSLIEIIIVVLLLAILGALVVPMFADTAPNKLRSAAQLLAADLSHAQVESVTNAEAPRVVVFNTATATYHLADASNSSTPLTNPVDKQPYRVTFGQGRAFALDNVTIKSHTAGSDNELEFGLYGNTDQATAAVITLACNGYTITVSVHPTTGETTIGSIN